MAEESLSDATTVAIVVHGVGDHSTNQILVHAKEGLAATGLGGAVATYVTIPTLTQSAASFEAPPALKISEGGLSHFVLPVVWSRMRARAAMEADPLPRQNVGQRFFLAMFLLLPSTYYALCCIPAADGWCRRMLVGSIAIVYAILAPGIAAAGFYLVVSLVSELAPAANDWWRAPALGVALLLLGWIGTRVLMVCDFVGDVVSYVGSPGHRMKGEDSVLDIVRLVAKVSPRGRILLIGHSLGSVLVTHSILRFRDDESIGSRLSIVTMGSPLRLMHWFFPERIRSPKQLLDQYERSNLATSWVNLWRDADWIGRALGGKASRFAETSLGDGAHPGYWSDPRCWAAVIKSMRATTEGSLGSLVSEWSSRPLNTWEQMELARKSAKLVQTSFLILCASTYYWYKVIKGDWLTGLNPWMQYVLLGLSGAITLLAAIHCGSQFKIAREGTTFRDILAGHRMNWSIALFLSKVIGAILLVTLFFYWK